MVKVDTLFLPVKIQIIMKVDPITSRLKHYYFSYSFILTNIDITNVVRRCLAVITM